MTLSKRSQRNTACRQRERTPFTKTCTAITWASMLFAASNVSAFSSLVRRSGLKSRAEFGISFAPEFGQLNFSPLCSKDSTGNSDCNPLRVPLTLTASALRRSSTPRRAGIASATRLNYSNGDELDSQPRLEENARVTDELQDKEAARWWQSVFQPDNVAPPREDDEQAVVDEYLEFLDKRYKRLHENEKKRPSPAPKKFSALGWLTADKSDPVSQQQEEDALYVLGVAELASERLLQKHHGSLQQYKRKTLEEAEKKQEVVIDAVAKEEPTEDTDVAVVSNDESSETRKALLFATLAQAGRNVLKGVSARRKALIAYQDKKVVAAMLLAFKTTVDAPIKAAKLLWNLGGGKKTIALTVSAFVTAFLVVRPVAQAVVGEATMSA